MYGLGCGVPVTVAIQYAVNRVQNWAQGRNA